MAKGHNAVLYVEALAKSFEPIRTRYLSIFWCLPPPPNISGITINQQADSEAKKYDVKLKNDT